MTIRKAQPTDEDEITDLVVQAYQHYVPRLGRRPAPMDAHYRDDIERGDAYVAVHDRTIVGVIILIPHVDHLLIENLAVRPDSEHLGVGSALLCLSESLAHRRNTPQLRLYTNELMTENIDYYMRRGFRETARRTEHGFRRVFFVKDVGTPT